MSVFIIHDALGTEMLDLISGAKAIATRLAEYGQERTIRSEHGGSRASLTLSTR